MLAMAISLVLSGCSTAAVNQSRQPVEPFDVPLFGGGVARSQDLHGKVVVVNFFASWCAPCRDEAPDLRRAWQEYSGRDVAFLGVDMQADDPTLARAFVEDLNVGYPSSQDRDGTMAESFRVVGLPSTYILGKDGHIAHRFIGPVKHDRLVSLIDTALTGK
jgi:cytochrome c biogenesis protein CcmG, thiol:disulfide interchange protein DsbE